MNPLTMNWAESILQKLIYFLLVATLVVADIVLIPLFDNSDAKGKIMNLFVNFIVLYIVTIWMSKGIVTFGRRVR